MDGSGKKSGRADYVASHAGTMSVELSMNVLTVDDDMAKLREADVAGDVEWEHRPQVAGHAIQPAG